MPAWLTQGLLTNWVSQLVFLIGAAVLSTVIAVLKRRSALWAVPALYGLGAFALLTIIWLGWIGIYAVASIPKQSPPVTAENVETNIRIWLDDVNFGVQKLPDQPDLYFNLGITTYAGRKLLVRRRKGNADRFIEFSSTIGLSPDEQVAYSKLSKDQAVKIGHTISLELATSFKVGFEVTATPATLTVLLVKGLPITANLTEDIFLSESDEVEAGVVLAELATRVALIDRTNLGGL